MEIILNYRLLSPRTLAELRPMAFCNLLIFANDWNWMKFNHQFTLTKVENGVLFCSGVFALLQAVAALKYLQNFLTKSEFKLFFFFAASVAAGVVFLTVVGLTWMGVIAPWSGR